MAQIHIPNPCAEAWDAMTPEGNGRHCAQCSRTVVDFTTWQQEDIVAYLQQQRGRTCGRFTKAQLNNSNSDTVLQNLASAAVPFVRKVAAILLLVFGVMVESCSDDKPAQVVGALKPIELAPEQPVTMGKPVAVARDTAAPVKKVIKKKKKIVPQEPEVLMGDVMPEVMGVPEWEPEPPHVDTVRK